MPGWAVAILSPQCERKATENLARKKLTYFFPRIKRTVRHRGKRVHHLDALFPNYLFLLLQDAWHEVFDMHGISGLIMSGDAPAKLDDAVIGEIKSRCNADGVYTPPPKPKFKTGETVRMSAGPLSDIKGSLAELRGEDRAIVLLGVLGKVNVAVSDLVAA